MSEFIPKLIKTDGTIRPVQPKQGKRFTLDEIRELIGCEWLQRIVPPNRTGAVIYCDEEGKMAVPFKPVNLPATEMWQEGCDPMSSRAFDTVVGDVLLCHVTQEPGDDEDE